MPWSAKDRLNYKFTTFPNQIQYQINFSTPFNPIPDKLTVNPMMKPAYDDGMADLLFFQIISEYLTI
jgi:hypothetical protein